MKGMFNSLKGLLWGIIACLLITVVASCTTTRYVSVPEVHTEYIHNTDTFTQHDTLIDYNETIIREVDSASLAAYGILLENQKKAYLVQSKKLQKEIQKQKEVKHDTVIKIDSIPYPVEVEKIVVKHDRSGWIAFTILSSILAILLVIKYKKFLF